LKNILFVCSGNTCRSPLAEGIAKKVFPAKLTVETRISSAGTSAVEGLPPSSLAVEVARKSGIDISRHRTRLLTAGLVKEADLIVVMASKHKQTVSALDPEALAYTYLLTDFCPEAGDDVPDPIGGGVEAYRETFRVIEKCVQAMAERLEGFEGWKQANKERKDASRKDAQDMDGR